MFVNVLKRLCSKRLRTISSFDAIASFSGNFLRGISESVTNVRFG